MKTLAEKTTHQLHSKGILADRDVAICRYGLEAFYASLLEVMSIFLLAGCVGNFLETLLFFLAFIPIRVYAGGYHANTRRKCYLTSLIVYGVFCTILAFLPKIFYLPVTLIGSIFSLLIVVAYAPIIHKNRRVGNTRKQRYRYISIAICSVEVIFILTLQVIFRENIFVFSMVLGLFCEVLSMLAEKVLYI